MKAGPRRIWSIVSETYDQGRVDAAAMFAVRNGIQNNPAAREAYIRHFDVENLKNSQLTSDDWPAFTMPSLT